MNKIKETNDQMLADIHSLQLMEQKIMDQLASEPDVDAETQKKRIDKMNELSTMRINMYKTLGEVNSFATTAIEQAKASESDQVLALRIVEQELNRAKQELKAVEEKRDNQVRLIEINTYFGDKYAEHTKLLKIAVYTIFGATVLFVLHTIGVFPSSIFYGILVIGTCVAAYYFWSIYAKIIMRDNMNYDEFMWPTPSASGSDAVLTDPENSTSDPWTISAGIPPFTCIGDQCCSEGMTYDTTKNRCVSQTEGFAPYVIEIYTKKQFGKESRADYNMSDLEPYNVE